MRSLPLSTLVFGLALGLLLAGSAPRAADDKKDKGDEPNKPDKVKFDTVDGVELHGDFYAPTAGASKKAPCVMLLHKVGSDSTKGDWEKLAKDLQGAGYAVLSFDFRGHGNSTSVSPNFWSDRTTPALATLTLFNQQQYKGSLNLSKPKDTISIKDFNKSYYPALVNDIAAAKLFLDRKNDSGECNSSNLILIGAEDGATLGALWMYSQMNLYEVSGVNVLGGVPKLASTPEGKDVTGAVWLSISPRLGTYSVRVSDWLKFAAKEQKVPMGFVCGDKDPTATFTKSCLQTVKQALADTKAAKLTAELLVKDTKLAGSALLGDKVSVDEKTSVRDAIVGKYLNKVKDELVAPAAKEHEFDKTAYAWTVNGRTIIAKLKDEKSLAPVPFLSFLGQ